MTCACHKLKERSSLSTIIWLSLACQQWCSSCQHFVFVIKSNNDRVIFVEKSLCYILKLDEVASLQLPDSS